VLSYAEVKALCIGNPLIKEKMDLDIQVSKLRMLEGSHNSQQHQFEDKVLKHYPRDTKAAKERIAGLEKDLERREAHAEEEFFMTVSGRTFTKDEKKEAGEALLAARNSVRGIKNATKVGEYKGFTMTLGYNYIREGFDLSLRADGVAHQVELGASATGNMTRIDNALEKIPERLEATKERLADLEKQLEAAKEELGRPFPQERELKEKSARLAELDILLSMDAQTQPEQAEENQTEHEEEHMPKSPEENSTPSESPNSESLLKPENSPEPESSPEPEGLPKPESFPNPESSVRLEIGERVVFSPQDGQTKLTGEIVNVSDTTVTLLAGRMEIPVIRDKGTFTEAPAPDRTETLEYAKELARRHVGENGLVYPASGTGSYSGPIVETTPMFAIQQTNTNVAILHRLKDLEGKGDFRQVRQGADIAIYKDLTGISISVLSKDGKQNDVERGGCYR
jgi:hypothetical protein